MGWEMWPALAAGLAVADVFQTADGPRGELRRAAGRFSLAVALVSDLLA